MNHRGAAPQVSEAKEPFATVPARSLTAAARRAAARA